MNDESRAYVDGLKLLARRELSELQVRVRLTRRGHDEAAIDSAVARLRAERAIDDGRAAETIARTETARRGRGKLRVRMQLERAGIATATANRAVDDAFSAIDETSLIEAALAKRLRPGDAIADERQLHKLYRYLTAQGFEPDRVMRAGTVMRDERTTNQPRSKP
jgi:regulatory protein